jgi:hypothetical protein
MMIKCFFTGNYILNYVASQPKLAPFVIQALIQVIAKITKLGWFEVQKEQFVFRELIADVKKFLQVRGNCCLIRMPLLAVFGLMPLSLRLWGFFVATITVLLFIIYPLGL